MLWSTGTFHLVTPQHFKNLKWILLVQDIDLFIRHGSVIFPLPDWFWYPRMYVTWKWFCCSFTCTTSFYCCVYSTSNLQLKVFFSFSGAYWLLYMGSMNTGNACRYWLCACLLFFSMSFLFYDFQWCGPWVNPFTNERKS